MGIPLRPDFGAREREQRRSYIRSVTALALSKTRKEGPLAIVRSAWPGDETAHLFTRAAVEPLKTTDFPRVNVIKLLASLAPRSGASKLFELAQPIDLSGINTVLFPLPTAITNAAFVAEAAPIPVLQGTLGAGMVIGPVRKLAVISVLTEEIENASAQTASVVMERLLSVGVARGLDKALFSANAPSATAPAGLLYGVAPIPAGATMAEDLGNLVETIAAAGFDPEAAAFLAAPAQAMAMRLIAGPLFQYKIIGAHGLPPASVVAIDTDALAFAYADQPETVISKETVLHLSDEVLALVGGGVTASPAMSTWQNGTLAVRTIGRVAWAVGAGALAWTQGVAW